MVKNPDAVTLGIIGNTPAPTNEENDNLKIKIMQESIKQIYDSNNITVKSEIISREQLLSISRGRVFANRYGCSIIDELCDTILENSLSLNRASRKEFENIITSAMRDSVVEETKAVPSLNQRFFGGK